MWDQQSALKIQRGLNISVSIFMQSNWGTCWLPFSCRKPWWIGGWKSCMKEAPEKLGLMRSLGKLASCLLRTHDSCLVTGAECQQGLTRERMRQVPFSLASWNKIFTKIRGAQIKIRSAHILCFAHAPSEEVRRHRREGKVAERCHGVSSFLCRLIPAKRWLAPESSPLETGIQTWRNMQTNSRLQM